MRCLAFLLVLLIPTVIARGDEPTVIYEGTAPSLPKQPQAFVANDDSVHLTFGVENRIFYARYAGQQFSQAREVAQVPNMSLGMRRGPRIAVADKSIVITAIGGPKGKGADGDIMSFRSTDNGLTWTEGVHVNDVAASAREGLHAMTATREGVLWCVWLDLRARKTELFASRSTDGGQTWQTNQLIYRSPDGSICECCHPSIVAEGKSIHVLFRNSVKGNRDMYIVSSSDGGESWGNAKPLGSDHWELNACPMDGGMLTLQNGLPKTVWRRGGMLYAADTKSSLETVIGKGEQPWISATAQGALVTWTAGREGDLFLSRLDGTPPQLLSPSARDAVVVSAKANPNWSMVFWEQRSGSKTEIKAQRISDQP